MNHLSSILPRPHCAAPLALVPKAALALVLAFSGLHCGSVPGLAAAYERIECLAVTEPLTASELRAIQPGAPQLPATLRAIQSSPDWQDCSGNLHDAGFSRAAHWWRFSGSRTDPSADNEPAHFLTLRWKTLSQADLFVFTRDANGSLRLIERQSAGDDRPRSVWPLMTGDYPAFRIEPQTETREHYLRVWSRSIQRFPIQLHTETSFQELFDTETMIIWIFAGVIFTVVLLSALFSIGLGESVYFYYGLYTAALWLNLNSIYGNAFRVLWPDSPWLAHKMIFFSQGVVLWASIVFFRKVSRLEVLSPRTDQIARVFQYAAAILIPLTLLEIPRVFFSRVYSFTYLFAIPTFITVMTRLILVQQQRNLIPFAAGWGLYYSLGIVHLTYLFGLVTYHPVPVFGMVLALPVETIVFGGGLFMRYRALLRESAEHEQEKQIALRKLEELHNPRRYANSKLLGLDTDGLLLRLNDLLERERIYRDETLTLKDLAGRLGISPHQLSELLNSRLNVNFRRLLATHRLKDAADLLLAAPERTVLEIALLVGFSSRTAFSEAFKQSCGVSPTQYRNRRSEL